MSIRTGVLFVKPTEARQVVFVNSIQRTYSRIDPAPAKRFSTQFVFMRTGCAEDAGGASASAAAIPAAAALPLVRNLSITVPPRAVRLRRRLARRKNRRLRFGERLHIPRRRGEALDVAIRVPIPASRASVEERERLAARLRQAYANERLSLETFVDRVNLVYAARTRDELEQLSADLADPGWAGRLVLAATKRLSLWTNLVAAAWREPRTPRLRLPIREEATIGRSRECDSVLVDPSVSRKHALLRQQEGSWRVRDLNSTNGTYVNGWRVIGEVEVRPGDEVSFGEATYRLVSSLR